LNKLFTAIAREITEQVSRGIDAVIQDVREELAAQGHRATGRLMDTLEKQITADILNGEWTANILMEDYGRFVNDGVRANRIAYQRGSGRQSSRYIAGLLDWAATVRPELDEKERRSFVFAVAEKHKKEGMPTAGSYAFSTNGRRLAFTEQDRYENAFTAQFDEERLAEAVVQFYARKFAA
jgi:hypothetical protein